MHRHFISVLSWVVVLGLASVASAQQPAPPPPRVPAPGTAATPAPATAPAPATTAGPVTAAAPATAPATAPAPVIQHIPIGSASRGDARAVFRVDYADLAGQILVRARPFGAPTESAIDVPALRVARAYEAELPAELVKPPGFVYWAVERRPDGTERPVFADASHPHPVHVVDPPHLRDSLARTGGHRSRVTVAGEYVDFGTRRLNAAVEPLPDWYYRLEASYAYGIYSAVDEIRFAIGRVRGEAADLDGPAPMPMEVGIDYGTAEVVWYLHPILRIHTSILFGYSQNGFEIGGASQLVIGRLDRTTFTAGVEGITTLGATGRVRLGWMIAPRLPMGASVEVTGFPAGEDAGVRLLQDLGYELYPGALLRVRAGYQSRTSIGGGPALGGDLALAF